MTVAGVGEAALDGFSVEVLSAQRVMEVFPLVRQLVPGISLESWRRHAASVLRDRSGRHGIVLVQRSGQRFPCGLCTIRLEQDLRQGRILTAEHGVVMASFGAREAFDALVQGVHEIAAARACVAVRWLLPKVPADPAELPRSTAIWAPLPAEAGLSPTVSAGRQKETIP